MYKDKEPLSAVPFIPAGFMYQRDADIITRLDYPNYTLSRGDKEYIKHALWKLNQLERESGQ